MTSLDLGFAIHGPAVLPSDHGYALYAAISRAIPALHGASWLGVHPIAGTSQGGALRLRERASLFLRLPADRVPDALPLAGKQLEIGGNTLRLGVPSVRALVPAASLDARLVLVKLTNAPRRENELLGCETLDSSAFAERYMAELTRQLTRLDIPLVPQLCGRRSMTVDGRRIIGYSVRVSGLSAAQSVALQTHGLGGKRRMGCGIFRPTRGR